MDRLVAAGAPAGAPAQERGVVAPADEELARRGLLLEMALEAEGLIAGNQHSLVYRAMHGVASCAAFPQRFVFKHKRSELRRVALAAGLVF